MSEVVKLRTRAEIDEEAATWIWRMESGVASNADPEGFEAWLRQDPRHRRAVEELSKVWETLDGLTQSQQDATAASAYLSAAPTAPLSAAPTTPLSAAPTAPLSAAPTTPLSAAPTPPLSAAPTSPLSAAPPFPLSASDPHAAPRNRRPLWLAAAAAALVAAVGSAIWLDKGSETQVLATAVGQHRNVTLADGSRVSLNTNTIVETNIGRHSREIFLRKGEAHFEVARDRSRPFLVHAGDAIVRAVGTEFEVRVRPDRHVDVLVSEGRVEVQPDASSSDEHGATTAAHEASMSVVHVRAVSAGQALSTATSNYPVIPVSPEQLSSELAWREGAVVFDSQPLAEAIAEIQRYTDSPIIITDPTITALPVGGRFKTDDLQGFLDGLQAALPVTIRRTSDGIVYVDPRH